MKMLNVDLLVLSLCLGLGTGFSAAEKTQYQIQNGPCSYTFLLPEQDNCQNQYNNYNYPVQKDGPTDNESIQRLEQLEISMENNTQWLLKVKLCHTLDISERNLNAVVKLYRSKLRVMTESLHRYQNCNDVKEDKMWWRAEGVTTGVSKWRYFHADLLSQRGQRLANYSLTILPLHLRASLKYTFMGGTDDYVKLAYFTWWMAHCVGPLALWYEKVLTKWTQEQFFLTQCVVT